MKQRLANKILCTYTFETRIQPDGSYEVSFIIYDKPGYGPKPIKYANLKKVLKKLGKMSVGMPYEFEDLHKKLVSLDYYRFGFENDKVSIPEERWR